MTSAVGRRGDGGEELAVHERGQLVGRRRARRRARSWSPSSGSVGRRRRQQALGGAEHDGEVDVEAGGAGQRADVDAVADLARGGPA